MQFRDIVGQDKIKQHLTSTFSSGRTAHAQLFLGPEGSGNLALAWAYAQYLMCEQPQEQDSCGQCNACRKISKLIHPDLHFSFPSIGTGKISNDFLPEWRKILTQNPYLTIHQWLNHLEPNGNKKGNITKNECVSIARKFTLKHAEGRYKVLILWMPEFLDKEGNRLLKLIEEPEPNTVFILVANNAEKILNTILSRCQLVRIHPLGDEEIAQHLTHKEQIDADKAKLIAYLAEGNLSKALDLQQNLDNHNATWLVEWLRLCLQGNGKKLVEWVEEINLGKKGAQFGRKERVIFLEYALFFIRECLLLQNMPTNTYTTRLPASVQTAAVWFSQNLRVEQMQQMMQKIDEMIYHIGRNAHPKLLFLEASIDLHHILKMQPQR